MLNLSIAAIFISLSLFFIAPVSQAANPCIDINTAPQKELEKIKHIGESRAKQIIMLREEKSFSSVDELDRVIGIGPSRVSDIKEQGLACVSDQPAVEAVVEIRPPIVEEKKPEIKIEVIYPQNIIINEILPSPEGSDETEEWIEIFNQNNFEVDLAGWQLTDIAGKTIIYTFPAGTKIPAMGFLILGRPETKIVLNNDSDGLNLIQPNGKIADSVNYEKAPQSQSYSLINSDWVWSKNLTPGTINRGPTSAKASASDKSSADKPADKEKGLAAVSEPITSGQNNDNFYPFLAALALAIFSGFVILILKKHVRT